MPQHTVAMADAVDAGGKSQPLVWVDSLETEEVRSRQRSDPSLETQSRQPCPHNEGLKWLRKATLTISTARPSRVSGGLEFTANYTPREGKLPKEGRGARMRPRLGRPRTSFWGPRQSL